MNLKKNTDAPKKAFWKKGNDQKNSTKRNEHYHSPLLTKIIVILSLVLAICIVGFIFYLKVSNPIIEKRSLIVGEQLSYCQELVTLKYRYSDVISVPPPKSKLPENSIFNGLVIVKIDGIIRIGIADVTMIDYEVYNNGKAVRIVLPAPEVLGNDIVSQSVFTERNGFVKPTTEDVFDKIDERRQERLDEILSDNKLIEEASEYAKRIITLSMQSCGFEEIYVIGGDH